MGSIGKIWLPCRDNPAYAGQFVWTGLDYLGESRSWPVVSSTSGFIDRIGFARPIGYERQSLWSDKPMVFVTRRVPAPTTARENFGGFEPLRRPQVLFADWTPGNFEPHEETVEVYSNCRTVELLLNDKSLGSQDRAPDDAPRVWKVPFEKGTLKAVGSTDAKTQASHELKTAGAAAKIVLASNVDAISPAWDDVALVTATVVDMDGVAVPAAINEITFAVGGPGSVYAVDSADPRSHESFRGNVRRAFQSRCQAIIKATAESGDITLTATSRIWPKRKWSASREGVKMMRKLSLWLSVFAIATGARLKAGPVTLTDSPDYYTMSNDILVAKVDKSNGNLNSLQYKGTEILDPNPRRTNAYWSHSAHSTDMTRRITIDPKSNNGQRAEVSVKGISHGQPMGSGPGGSAVADIEIRWNLGAADSAIYTYSIWEHQEDYPRTSVGEARFCAKLNDAVFDWMTVDAKAQLMLMPTAYELEPWHGHEHEGSPDSSATARAQRARQLDRARLQRPISSMSWRGDGRAPRTRSGVYFVNRDQRLKPTSRAGDEPRIELSAYQDATFTPDDKAGACCPPCACSITARDRYYGGSSIVVVSKEEHSDESHRARSRSIAQFHYS